MPESSRQRVPSPGEGAAGLPSRPGAAAVPVEEIAGWDQGVAYVETILAQLVADRTEAADLIRAAARVTAVDEARAQALAHVVGEAVRAALRADTARAAARLEVVERLQEVLPLRDTAVEVLARLGEAITTLQAGRQELAALFPDGGER